MIERGERTQAATLAALGLAVAALLAMGWILFDAAGRAQRTQVLQQASMQMLERLAGLRESLALAESGHRGFLLTGDPQFLKLREEALAQLWQQSTTLQAEASGPAPQQERSRRLAQMLVERVGMMRRSERLRTARGNGAANASFADEIAEQANGRIRTLVNEWARDETGKLSSLLQDKQRDQTATWRMLLYLGLAVTALMLPVLWGILRQSRATGREKARLREIADSLPGTVYVFRRSREGIDSFDFLSTNAGTVMGLAREQLLRDATGMRGAVLEEDLDSLAAAIECSAATLAPLEVDFRVRAPGGGIRWLRSSGIPVREGGGDVVWNGYWTDITDVKRVEDALRSAMQRLENAQRVARLGDWTCDLATGAVTWSPQVYRMLGRDPAAGAPDLDEGVAMFENGAEATAAAFFDAQESGEPRAFELTANLDSGGRVDLHVIVVPDLGADGKVRGMRGTIQDITERKALEKHLFQAKEAADNANNAKTVFLATMSHEIRTHLNGMLGVLELIALAPANQEFRTALGEVRESGKSLQRIIDDILDFSKVEAGKLDIHLEPGNIVELVAGVHRIHAASAANQGLDMHYHVDPRISPAVMIDALRMRQILGNFVSNAIKFTPRGEVVLRGILLARDGRYERLRFEVEDTGIGIPLERQQRLFQPFEQAEADTASRFGGSGLGLSISRRLAELMRGEVGMSSAPGLGTTMWLELTVAVADVERSMRSLGKREAAPPLPGPTPVVPLAAAKPDARAPRVLVVDDHPVNRMVMRRQLETLGYATDEAASGDEALEQWGGGKFALVLSDCNMPGMSGYDLSRRIRVAEAERGLARTPIIACSANVMRGVRQECRDAGMDDYISKPTELVTMAEVMARWLPLPSQATQAPPPEASPPVSALGAQPGSVLDAHALNAVSRGDPVAADRVLAHFKRVNQADAEALLQALDRDDNADIARLAHRIKGACGFIGAAGLASACARLEKAARAGDGQAVTGLAGDFRTELERLNAYLDAR